MDDPLPTPRSKGEGSCNNVTMGTGGSLNVLINALNFPSKKIAFFLTVERKKKRNKTYLLKFSDPENGSNSSSLFRYVLYQGRGWR